MNARIGLAALGFGIACAASAASVPLWRSLCRRWGHVDDPGHRKIHVQPVPLAGGFAVLTGWILGGLLIGLVAVFGGPSQNGWLPVTGGGTEGLRRLAVLAAGALGMAALGACDDRRDLRPGVKFLVQAVIAIGVTWGIQAPFPDSIGLAGRALTLLWILGVTNAFNLSDNMNGLCAGLGFIGAVGVAVSSLSGAGGHWQLGCLAAITAGTLAGYLPFNYPRASVFLGDAGSQWVGYVLSVLGLLEATAVRMSGGGWSRAWVAAAVVVAVPVIDMVFVTLSRTWKGQPFWVGDTQHLSHRLARAGLGKPGAVALLWVSGILLSLFRWF